jgi:hypothetical protein
MATFQYNGSDERVFPSIAITVEPGDTFDAPDDFSAFNVSLTKQTKPTAPAPTVGE